MKAIKILLPASIITSLIIIVLMFATDQDPETTIISKIWDFAGLTIVISALLFAISLLSYKVILFTKHLWGQNRK